MVWKATPEKNSFAIFFSPFGRRGLIIVIYVITIEIMSLLWEMNIEFGVFVILSSSVSIKMGPATPSILGLKFKMQINRVTTGIELCLHLIKTISAGGL